MTNSVPDSPLTSAAPPVWIRWVAFTSILIGGACGAMIGYGFTDLQCTGNCQGWLSAGTIIGAVCGAVGVAIVAVLALRAMDEWESIKVTGSTRRNTRR